MPVSTPALPTASRPPLGRVLIVDDNAELVDTLRAVIASGVSGLAIETAANGKAALAMARKGFDVAIVDVKLPDISGVDLIAPLREASPFSEVLLLTGFASVDAAIGALRSGAFAFVLKSFRPEELISIVEQALGKVQLKREREELERRYRDLVEVTDVLFTAVDENDNVALMNRKAASIVDVAPDAAIGQPLLESWIPSDDRAAMRSALVQTRDALQTRAVEVETGFADLSGVTPSRRRVRWHLSRSPGDRALVYGIGIDITERRALERRAADAEALSAMGELAMNLAHEIRNPLNAAVLQLHLLKRNLDRIEAEAPVRATLQDRVRIVGDEIGRLNRLLTEFLELARPRGIGREPVHVPSLVDEVLDLEEESAKGRGVQFVRDLCEEGGVALGDREKLKQVTINIVVNAIEAMKQGGTLTVRVRPEGERVVMTLEDTGPGIDPDVLSNVFDPFFTTKEAGTGLGLSIVRKIVDQHGGEVHIESERGKGAKVTVSIPMGR
ncbi:Two-component sensor histidine kinase [Labilithrix luteola]|uniref:histidine kinase n=1 Tax=Labilithrix luteola TaxID=1391654 RepID=A0A0K1Q5D4_9BACT|nr:ATP-binding protein [Labilithrix luteola]AKV01041.1 Two-component sensor histidine kinase [Labilithrix luteola]